MRRILSPPCPTTPHSVPILWRMWRLVPPVTVLSDAPTPHGGNGYWEIARANSIVISVEPFFIGMGNITMLDITSFCQPLPCCDSTSYYPQLRISRINQCHTGELLRIEIANPWAGLLLLNVRVAFLAADPNPCGQNGQVMVTFSTTKGILFGDIAYSPPSGNRYATIVRDILLHPLTPDMSACQFYAGVCFRGLSNTTKTNLQESYMLYKSGCLPKAN